MSDIVYFELNNWFAGEDYPDAEPFLSWLGNDFNQTLLSEEWAKENKLCIVATPIDMSMNYCVTATKEWVLKNCPDLLSDKEYDVAFIHGYIGKEEEVVVRHSFREFLRYPDRYGDVYSRFGMEFLPYEEDNFGVTEVLYDVDDFLDYDYVEGDEK